MNKFHWFVLALVLAVPGVGAEIEWWELRTPYTYKDLDGVCAEPTPSLWEKLFVSAEVEDGKVLRANLKSSPTPKSSSHALGAGELASLKLYEDDYGKAWIEEVTLDNDSLLWIANNLGNYFCKPPQPLTVIEQQTLRVAFDTQKLGVEYLITLSDEFSLQGNRKDGEPFQLDFRFEQRRYK